MSANDSLAELLTTGRGCIRATATWPALGAAVLASFGGLLAGLSFFGFDQAWGAWLCLVPLLWAVEGRRWTTSVALGLVFGTTELLVGCGWLLPALRSFAGLERGAALAVLLAFALLQGAVFGAFAGLLRALPGPRWLTAPAALGVCEGLWPGPFPSALGHALYASPTLAQGLALGGAHLLSLLLAMGSGLAFEAWRRRRVPKLGALAFAALWAVVALYGRASGPTREAARSEDAVRIGVVQPSVAPRVLPREGLERLLRQSAALADRVDLIVWPETAANLGIPEDARSVREHLGTPGVPLLFGASRLLPRARARGFEPITNSAVLVDGAANVLDARDKVALIPFAESVPFAPLWPRLATWTRHGTLVQPGVEVRPLRLGPLRIGAFVCFEGVGPAVVRALMAGGPHVLVALVDDSWFGSRRERALHLALSRIRAIESRRYLVRAAGSGISAVIDPWGRVLASTGIGTSENLVATVPRMSGTTPFARFGDWPVVVCGVAVALLFLRRRVRSPAKG